VRASARQAIEERAHQGVERQRLQDVALEESDETRRRCGQQRYRDRAAGRAADAEQYRDAEQHAPCGQPRRD